MRCLVCEREFITPTANRCPYCAFLLTVPVLSIEALSFLADLLLVREQGINLDRIRRAVRDTYWSSDQDYRTLKEIGMKPYIAQWYATLSGPFECACCRLSGDVLKLSSNCI